MRQLSAKGRAAAQRIGAAIRRLDIPIGRVLASEYCRTRETARLMNLGPVGTTREITNIRGVELVTQLGPAD
jgi:phosphohistidine phosphatase SixA